MFMRFGETAILKQMVILLQIYGIVYLFGICSAAGHIY
jgi:hypothetical protein